MLGQFGLGAADGEVEVFEAAGHLGGPAVVAEVPPQFAGDGGNGKGQEMRTPVGFEAVDGVDQADGGDLAEIVEWFPAAGVAAGEVFGHREIAADELVA